MLLQRVAKIECLPSVCPDFVFALLRSNAFGSYFEPETTGVSVPHISGEQILAFRFACPPVSEQKEITEEIQRLSNELTKIADKARGTINVLHERRSSLISAAVTGKIDIAGRI
jgi:type I restriction enzyme S subunit